MAERVLLCLLPIQLLGSHIVWVVVLIIIVTEDNSHKKAKDLVEIFIKELNTSETTFGPHMLLVFVPVVASQLRNWRTPSCFFLLNICFICPGCDYRFREKVETACLCPVIVNIKVSWGTWLIERSHFATYPSLKVTIPWSTQFYRKMLGVSIE